jgi:hypothetical protein
MLKNISIKKIEMMITYASTFENTHNLKIVILEIFRNSKYNFRMLNFEESFANVNGS